MTDEEIAAMVADSMKETLALANGILADNVRLTAENEALKNPKKEEIKLATKEELDAVMRAIVPGYEVQPKPDKEKTADEKSISNIIDDFMKLI